MDDNNTPANTADDIRGNFATTLWHEVMEHSGQQLLGIHNAHDTNSNDTSLTDPGHGIDNLGRRAWNFLDQTGTTYLPNQ